MKNFFATCILLVSTSSFGNIIEVGNGINSVFPDCTIGCMADYSQAYDGSYFAPGQQVIDSMTFYGQSGATGIYNVSVGYISDYSMGNLVSNAFDLVNVGTVDLAAMLNNKLVVSTDFTYDTALGDLFINFGRTSTASSGNFAASTGYLWSRAYIWPWGGENKGSNGYALNTTFVTSAVNAVPEPSILALLGLGLFAIGLSRRKITK